MDPPLRRQWKKPRLDACHKEDVWGPDEDFSEEVLAQVDLAASQAYSQANVAKKYKPDNRLQRHHSWSNTPTKEDSHTSSNKWPSFQVHNIENITKEGSEIKSKSSPSSFLSSKPRICQPTSQCNNIIPQSSVHELGRQRLEILSLKKENDTLAEQIKNLQELLTRKDFENQTIQDERDNLKDRLSTEQREKQLHIEELEKLKTELEFKKQELTSGKWLNVQHSARQNSKLNLSQSISSQRKRQLIKSSHTDDGTNPFPNSQSFSKSLDERRLENLKKATENFKVNMCKAAEFALSDAKEPDFSRMNLNHPSGMETTQGLVRKLLQETVDYWDPDVLILLSSKSKKSESFTNDHKMEVEDSHAMKDSQYIQDLCTKFCLGLTKLLDDNDELHGDQQLVENFNLKRCLRLNRDCCEELLPFLEKAICLQWWNESSSAKSDHSLKNDSAGNCTRNGSLLDLPAEPTIATLPVFFSECSQHVAVSSMLIGLKVLKQIVCYSDKVCHCLLSVMCSNSSPQSAQISSCGFVNLASSGPSNTEPKANIRRETSPTLSSYNIIQRLFSLFSSQTLDVDNPVFANLFIICLEIFECIAASSKIEYLKGFIPLLNSISVKTCTSLKHDGTVLLAFISLLRMLCSSPAIIEASCDQEEFCLWILLSESWQKSRNILSTKQMLQLDHGMIKLISRCLVDMVVKPPFFAADECHCPFEMIQSFILYLYSQQLNHAKGSNLDIPTLRSGVSLLHHIALKDVHFHDHKQIVNDELISFLYWLPEIHKLHNLGQAADALLEMWAIGSESGDSD